MNISLTWILIGVAIFIGFLVYSTGSTEVVYELKDLALGFVDDVMDLRS